MNDLKIRNFKYTDVDDFIRISKLSFAEETLASGITPEDFEQETRRIFRWKMIPYRLLTALIGVKWEGFVAEKDGKVVGGGMYIGRNNRMSITNLMVDPEYRRQGIGQALLIRRLERMTERGFPFAMAQVLETNTASLQNLRKQNFEVFNQYSVYEHTLPLPESYDSSIPPISVREISHSDQSIIQRNREQDHSSICPERQRQRRNPVFFVWMAKNVCTICQIFQMDQSCECLRRNDRLFMCRVPGSAAKRVANSTHCCRGLLEFVTCYAPNGRNLAGAIGKRIHDRRNPRSMGQDSRLLA